MWIYNSNRIIKKRTTDADTANLKVLAAASSGGERGPPVGPVPRTVAQWWLGLCYAIRRWTRTCKGGSTQAQTLRVNRTRLVVQVIQYE
jgi:hypothetical protein